MLFVGYILRSIVIFSFLTFIVLGVLAVFTLLSARQGGALYAYPGASIVFNLTCEYEELSGDGWSARVPASTGLSGAVLSIVNPLRGWVTVERVYASGFGAVDIGERVAPGGEGRFDITSLFLRNASFVYAGVTPGSVIPVGGSPVLAPVEVHVSPLPPPTVDPVFGGACGVAGVSGSSVSGGDCGYYVVRNASGAFFLVARLYLDSVEHVASLAVRDDDSFTRAAGAGYAYVPELGGETYFAYAGSSIYDSPRTVYLAVYSDGNKVLARVGGYSEQYAVSLPSVEGTALLVNRSSDSAGITISVERGARRIVLDAGSNEYALYSSGVLVETGSAASSHSFNSTHSLGVNVAYSDACTNCDARVLFERTMRRDGGKWYVTYKYATASVESGAWARVYSFDVDDDGRSDAIVLLVARSGEVVVKAFYLRAGLGLSVNDYTVIVAPRNLASIDTRVYDRPYARVTIMYYKSVQYSDEAYTLPATVPLAASNATVEFTYALAPSKYITVTNLAPGDTVIVEGGGERRVYTAQDAALTIDVDSEFSARSIYEALASGGFTVRVERSTSNILARIRTSDIIAVVRLGGDAEPVEVQKIYAGECYTTVNSTSATATLEPLGRLVKLCVSGECWVVSSVVVDARNATITIDGSLVATHGVVLADARTVRVEQFGEVLTVGGWSSISVSGSFRLVGR